MFSDQTGELLCINSQMDRSLQIDQFICNVASTTFLKQLARALIVIQNTPYLLSDKLGNDLKLTRWSRYKMAANFPDDVFKCIFLNENT